MEIIKFYINIIKKVIKIIFNNKIEINILLYFTILALELVIYLSMIIIMKGVNNKSSHIIGYILKVFIHIKNVMIYQSFFMLEHGSN